MRSRLQTKERGGEQEAGLPSCTHHLSGMKVTRTVGGVPPGGQGGLGCRLLFQQMMGREGAGAGEGGERGKRKEERGGRREEGEGGGERGKRREEGEEEGGGGGGGRREEEEGEDMASASQHGSGG